MVAHPQIDATVPDNLMALRTAHTELAKAVGRGQPTLRDPAGHVLALNPASSTPLLAAQGHNVGLNFRDDTLHITDETGVTPRNLNVGLLATQVIGPPPGSTTAMKVYGEIGDPGQAWNAYATLHGDSNGTHNGNLQGEVGVQGQAWNAYATLWGNSNGAHYGDTHGNHFGDLSGNTFGTHFGEVGTQAQPYNHWGDSNGIHYGQNQGTLFGEVGVPGQAWNLYATLHGTVVAPSERVLKTDITDLPDAGHIVDIVPAYRWRWGENASPDWDRHEHAGPMTDDLANAAPWLIRDTPGMAARGYGDRDLIGVLWAALRESRNRITDLESRVAALEH